MRVCVTLNHVWWQAWTRHVIHSTSQLSWSWPKDAAVSLQFLLVSFSFFPGGRTAFYRSILLCHYVDLHIMLKSRQCFIINQSIFMLCSLCKFKLLLWSQNITMVQVQVHLNINKVNNHLDLKWLVLGSMCEILAGPWWYWNTHMTAIISTLCF